MELAEHVDQMGAFSGHGDSHAAGVGPVCGVHVTVVSTISIQPRMIAEDLRRQVDRFIELLYPKSQTKSVCRAALEASPTTRAERRSPLLFRQDENECRLHEAPLISLAAVEDSA